jgi:hypothetical protein
METKTIVNYAVGLGLLGLTIYVISKTWKLGQK